MATARKPRAPRKSALPPVIEQEVVVNEPEKKKFNWKLWLPWIIASLSMITLLIILFSKKDKPVSKEKTYTVGEVSALIGERNAWRDRARVDSAGKEQYKQLSFELLNRAQTQNKTYYVESKKQYDAIPDIVRAMSKHQLRNAITNVVDSSKKP